MSEIAALCSLCWVVVDINNLVQVACHNTGHLSQLFKFKEAAGGILRAHQLPAIIPRTLHTSNSHQVITLAVTAQCLTHKAQLNNIFQANLAKLLTENLTPRCMHILPVLMLEIVGWNRT